MNWPVDHGKRVREKSVLSLNSRRFLIARYEFLSKANGCGHPGTSPPYRAPIILPRGYSTIRGLIGMSGSREPVFVYKVAGWPVATLEHAKQLEDA